MAREILKISVTKLLKTIRTFKVCGFDEHLFAPVNPIEPYVSLFELLTGNG